MSMKKGRPPIKVKRPRQPAVRHKAGPLALLNFVVNKTASFFLYSFRQFSTWKRNWIKDDKRSNPLKIKAFSVCRYYTVTAHIRDVITEKRRGRADAFRNAGSLQRRIHAQHLRSLDTRYETERSRRDRKHHPQRDLSPKPKRRLQLAAAVQTFKIFLKTEKLELFCQINLNKSTAF